MTDQDEYQSPEPLRTYDAKIYIRDRKKCLERGCRNLETRCKDCGRLVCNKTLPPLLEWIKVETKFDSETGDMHSNVPFARLLVTNGKWVDYVDHYGWDDGVYYFSNDTGKLYGVTHFMNLPEPPKE